MYVYQRNKPIRGCLMVFSIVFWCTGISLIFLGLYMILEPKRSYILDLVDFSEDDPLLRFASYVCIVTGFFTLLVGFLGCCGSIKAERCMVVSFLIFLVFIFFAEISIGVLGILYRNKFTENRMEIYLANMSHNRYYRDKWVLPLMDTIQFYIVSRQFSNHLQSLMQNDYGIYAMREKNRKITNLIDKLQFHLNCCGAYSPSDWLPSQWRSNIPTDNLVFNSDSPYLAIINKVENDEKATLTTLPNVPDSCCVQMQGATVNNRIGKSLIRCQQPSTSRQWRYQSQQCCGGKGPLDYYDSFWYITNTIHGTRSFVPPSCCKQNQNGRAWLIQPIDPMCTTYNYYTSAFNTSINIEGCHEKLQQWLNEQTTLFATIGFSFATFQLIGIAISIILWRRINDYVYVDSYDR